MQSALFTEQSLVTAHIFQIICNIIVFKVLFCFLLKKDKQKLLPDKIITLQ